jgi:hypothetical protein
LLEIAGGTHFQGMAQLFNIGRASIHVMGGFFLVGSRISFHVQLIQMSTGQMNCLQHENGKLVMDGNANG